MAEPWTRGQFATYIRGQLQAQGYDLTTLTAETFVIRPCTGCDYEGCHGWALALDYSKLTRLMEGA